MTFNASVPLNGDSPGVYPAQNQVNMQRLQAIVGANHQFNLSAAANDGYHNLINMTLQAPSGPLADTGRTYVKISGGLVQLFYMDDAGTEYQVTPDYVNSTMKISGSISLASHASHTILAVAYNFTGLGTTFIDATTTQSTANFYRSGSTTSLDTLNTSGQFPEFIFSGTDLTVRNNDSVTRTIVWSLMINRL